MGGSSSSIAIVLPDDPRLHKLSKTFYLSQSDINKFTKYFNKLDAERTGLVTFDRLFEFLDSRRSVYTDELMDLFGIEFIDPELDFNDFCIFICNYCFFEKNEIIRFCLFMFDSDQQGFIASEDVKTLMNTINHIVAPETVKGNVKKSWRLAEFNTDDKVAVDDLMVLSSKFPNIFAPAFMLQQTMMRKILGESWWTNKKWQLIDTKNKLKKIADAKKKRKEKRDKRKADAHIIKKMGSLKYFLCPCLRFLYDENYIDSWMSADMANQRAEAIALKRRQEALAAKNPTTHAWSKFERSINPEKGGNANAVKEVYDNTETFREVRKTTRAERAEERKKQDHFKHTPLQ